MLIEHNFEDLSQRQNVNEVSSIDSHQNFGYLTRKCIHFHAFDSLNITDTVCVHELKFTFILLLLRSNFFHNFDFIVIVKNKDVGRNYNHISMFRTMKISHIIEY